MKKVLILIVLLTLTGAVCLSAQDAGKPMELTIHGMMEIPGFATGPILDFYYMPWSIPVGDGKANYLGFGASVGAMFTFTSGFGVAFPVTGIFIGRFDVFKKMILDMDVRMGVFIGNNVIFHGMTNLFFIFNRLRFGTGFLFGAYGSYMLYSFTLSVGYRIPLRR